MNKEESYEDLTKVSMDKLIKLKDVAEDNSLELYKEYMDANVHLMNIKLEIHKRKTALQELSRLTEDLYSVHGEQDLSFLDTWKSK